MRDQGLCLGCARCPSHNPAATDREVVRARRDELPVSLPVEGTDHDGWVGAALTSFCLSSAQS